MELCLSLLHITNKPLPTQVPLLISFIFALFLQCKPCDALQFKIKKSFFRGEYTIDTKNIKNFLLV